jgi:hypothetical protein
MRLVLDANEYIYALGPDAAPSGDLLGFLSRAHGFDVRIVRTIVEEVLRNTPERLHRDFFDSLRLLIEDGFGVDEEFVVPHHVAQHYQDIGFKEGDAHIAAYAEVIGADILVSENRRHFHTLAGHLPFQVTDAEQFLRRHAPGP